MIAGEYAEAAGVQRQRIVYAKLGAKISDWMFRRDRTCRNAIRLHVRFKTLGQALHAFQINGIARGLGETIRRNPGQQLSWVIFAFCPKLRIEIAKDGSAVDRKSTRLNSSHSQISYAVFCLKKKKKK